MPSMISSTLQPIAPASSAGGGGAAQRLGQLGGRGADLHPQLLQPPRHPDGPALVAEVALDLADDRGRRVGGELHAAIGVEAVDGLDEPDRADLDEVLEGLAAVAEAAGAVLDQRQVQVHQRVAGAGRGRARWTPRRAGPGRARRCGGGSPRCPGAAGWRRRARAGRGAPRRAAGSGPGPVASGGREAGTVYRPSPSAVGVHHHRDHEPAVAGADVGGGRQRREHLPREAVVVGGGGLRPTVDRHRERSARRGAGGSARPGRRPRRPRAAPSRRPRRPRCAGPRCRRW